MQLCLCLAFFLVVDSANPQTRRAAVMDRLEQESHGLSAYIVLASLQWVAAYAAFNHFPDSELPDCYPFYKIVSSFSGLVALGCLGLASKYYRTQGAKLSVCYAIKCT